MRVGLTTFLCMLLTLNTSFASGVCDELASVLEKRDELIKARKLEVALQEVESEHKSTVKGFSLLEKFTMWPASGALMAKVTGFFTDKTKQANQIKELKKSVESLKQSLAKKKLVYEQMEKEFLKDGVIGETQKGMLIKQKAEVDAAKKALDAKKGHLSWQINKYQKGTFKHVKRTVNGSKNKVKTAAKIAKDGTKKAVKKNKKVLILGGLALIAMGGKSIFNDKANEDYNELKLKNNPLSILGIYTINDKVEACKLIYSDYDFELKVRALDEALEHAMHDFSADNLYKDLAEVDNSLSRENLKDVEIGDTGKTKTKITVKVNKK